MPWATSSPINSELIIVVTEMRDWSERRLLQSKSILSRKSMMCAIRGTKNPYGVNPYGVTCRKRLTEANIILGRNKRSNLSIIAAAYHWIINKENKTINSHWAST